MRALWVVIGVNVLAVSVLGGIAYGVGGGFTSGTFPPNTPVVMMRLVPVENLPAKPQSPSAASVGRAAPALPVEYRAVEPAIDRWETGADGRVRFRD